MDDQSRWAAVVARDPAADRCFLYGVRTTKIFCRPICKARLARRANVTFFEHAQQARSAGLRPCKRCKPEMVSAMPPEDAETRVRAFIARPPSRRPATACEMARHVGLSQWHFHRVFKKVTGLTPREYYSSPLSQSNLQSEMPTPTDSTLLTEVRTSADVLTFDNMVGFGAQGFRGDTVHAACDFWYCDSLSSRSDANKSSCPLLAIMIGMSANVSNRQDDGVNQAVELPVVEYTVQETSFGRLLLAFQYGKVGLIGQAETHEELLSSMHRRFPLSQYRHIVLKETEQDSRLHSHVQFILTVLEMRL